MNVKIIKESGIRRPDAVKMGSSILDHVDAAGNLVTMRGDYGLRNDAGLWPSYNCTGPGISIPFECVNTDEADNFRTFGQGQWMPGMAFQIESGVQCKALGLDKADMASEVERVYGLVEGQSVERALLDYRFVASGSDDPVQWDAPTDVTPGTDVSLAVALALLEGYAAANYAGVPTIHMPRAAASILNERLVWRDGLAYTRLGSKVALGGGYDVNLDDGEWDLYATGEVYVEQSPLVSTDLYVLPGDGSGVGSDQNGLGDNTVLAIADRMYRVGIDCFVAKATGKVW